MQKTFASPCVSFEGEGEEGEEGGDSGLEVVVKDCFSEQGWRVG
jgi:hypothetical protein